MINYKMLEYDRIDLSEGIDTQNKLVSRECSLYGFSLFLRQKF